MLKQFFIICSGADTDILKECSVGEQNKFAGIGATVFFTAVMATIAASYALYTVFDTLYSAIFFGLIWGLLIFNLDRYIVSTIKKRDSVIDEILQATPRILLAVIIAVVISKPLELKIFEKEINQVLLEQKNNLTLANQNQIAEQFTPKITELQNSITGLQSSIDTKEAEVNALYDIYISEAEGTAGTELLGKGPVYKEKRDKHDAALTELQQLKSDNKAKISAVESEITSLQSAYDTNVATSQPVIDNFDGLMARVNALGTLPWLPSFFIFLLFLAIETSPIFAKLLSPKGEFDFRLQDQETTVKTWTTQKVNERKLLLKTDNDINNKVYNEIADEEEVINYKRKKAKELMQLQADAFFKNQKSAL
jgi:peptidoglycan hydrolase CwlO-like protein